MHVCFPLFLTVHKHIIQYIYISKPKLRFNKRTNEKTFSINLNATHQNIRFLDNKKQTPTDQNE